MHTRRSAVFKNENRVLSFIMRLWIFSTISSEGFNWDFFFFLPFDLHSMSNDIVYLMEQSLFWPTFGCMYAGMFSYQLRSSGCRYFCPNIFVRFKLSQIERSVLVNSHFTPRIFGRIEVWALILTRSALTHSGWYFQSRCPGGRRNFCLSLKSLADRIRSSFRIELYLAQSFSALTPTSFSVPADEHDATTIMLPCGLGVLRLVSSVGFLPNVALHAKAKKLHFKSNRPSGMQTGFLKFFFFSTLP